MNIAPVDKMIPVPQNTRENIVMCLRSIAGSIEKADLYDAESLVLDMDSGFRVIYKDDIPFRDLNGTHRFTIDVSWYEKDRETHLWDSLSLGDKESDV